MTEDPMLDDVQVRAMLEQAAAEDWPDARVIEAYFATDYGRAHPPNVDWQKADRGKLDRVLAMVDGMLRGDR